MRTRTIYGAMAQADREMLVGLASYSVHVHDPELVKRTRQRFTFERELLRRMDERDAWKTMFPVSTPIQVAIGLVTAHVERGGK